MSPFNSVYFWQTYLDPDINTFYEASFSKVLFDVFKALA